MIIFTEISCTETLISKLCFYVQVTQFKQKYKAAQHPVQNTTEQNEKKENDNTCDNEYKDILQIYQNQINEIGSLQNKSN